MSNKIMLNIKTIIYYCLCLNVLLTACQSDVSTSEERGSGLLISLSDDVAVESRAVPSELDTPLAANFDLEISSKATGTILYKDKFTNNLIPASQGAYSIVASYGDNQELGVDAPYYEGSVEAFVEDDKPTSVSIVCKVANALTSVVFNNGEVFEKEFSDCALKVSVGSMYTLLEYGGNKSAYYRAGSHPSFMFVGTLKDGSKVEFPITDDKLQDDATFAAGAHCKITLSINAVSGLKLKIEKIEVEKVTINETIPVAWLPKPKVSGFSDITYVETDDAPQNAKISYTASLPIEDMELTLGMEDEQYSEYNKTYTLTALSDDDRTNLEKLGIELPQVGAVKTGTIDLNNLVGTMQTNAGATVDNTFSLRVKANGRWSDETTPAETYKVEVVKPEFAVSVDERNCWSREFTVDEITATSGNIDKLKSNLVYQYYNGSEWVECANRASEKGRLQQFASRAEEITTKQYKVRALYRGAIPSNEVTATLETPEQLPNSDMEEWTDDVYYTWTSGWGSNKKTYHYYSFNPWSSEDSKIWDTNNSFTTRHRYNQNSTKANYNGFSAVSYVLGHGGKGLAAELRNTVNGRGNTVTISQDYNKVAGELFTGTANISMGATGNMFVDASGADDKYTKVEGVTFNSRPTVLSFYYKYSPYTDDAWSVDVELLDESKNKIKTQHFESSESKSDWTLLSVPIGYETNSIYSKCKYIYVIFKSSTKSGKDLPFHEVTYTFQVRNNGKLESQTYEKALVGSVLTIDDISLVYDK